jgi:spermidine/putrescine transport system substrate-binding protein
LFVTGNREAGVHPNEGRIPAHVLTRRDFLRRTAGTALVMSSVGAFLAACQRREEEAGGSATEVGFARPDSPVQLPLFDDNPPIGDGLSPEAGPLRIFNWNDYIYKKVLKRFESEFGVEIEYDQFTSMAEAISKIQNDAVEFDLFFPTADHLRSLVLAKKVQPLNRTYLSNFESNTWPALKDPFYDRGSRYTTPYLVWKTGVGYRRDLIQSEPSGDFASAFGVLWDPRYEGEVGVLDEYRDTMSMTLLRNGAGDVNTEDADEIRAAGDALLDLSAAVNVNVNPPDYQALGEGVHTLRYAWSGNLNYTRYYLPEGTSPDVLGFYYPPGGVVGNDMIVVARDAQSPVLAHMFINFLFDQTNALDNFGYEGYQPPLVGIEESEWLDAGYIPDNLNTTIVQPEDFETAQYISALPPDADQLWQDAWAEFKAGVKAD